MYFHIFLWTIILINTKHFLNFSFNVIPQKLIFYTTINFISKFLDRSYLLLLNSPILFSLAGICDFCAQHILGMFSLPSEFLLIFKWVKAAD